jgi:glycosyltransferase involved in cell wall biosynthesis
MHLTLRLGYGGAELGLIKLANGHDRQKIVPSICSCAPADTVKDRLLPDVRLFEFNRRRDGNDLGFVLQLWRLLRQERPDILHTHGWATLIEGAVAARLAGVPLIIHGEHGTMETRWRNIQVQRFMWGRVDGVLSVSSRLANKLSTTVGFPTDRIATIRNGVDTTRFSPDKRAASRRQLGLSPSAVLVGAVGRLVPVKDHQSLLKALATLLADGVDCEGVVVGEGPLDGDLERLIATLGIQHRVRVSGPDRTSRN